MTSILFLAWTTSCGRSQLTVTAPGTTLGVGESVALTVTAPGPGLLGRTALDPRTLKFSTTAEDFIVPEGDGRVTCVGTNRKEHETAIVSASTGRAHHG